jgi:hypothetical protein
MQKEIKLIILKEEVQLFVLYPYKLGVEKNNQKVVA